MMEPRILKINDTCTGCGACVNVCPKSCLQMRQDEEGFYYPIYDSSICIECGLCENACHILSETTHTPPDTNNFFIYHSKDDNLLTSSSSGGGFTLFANWILQQEGVVYGSRYNSEKERLEVFSTDQTSIESLRKSKYIESYTGTAFSEVRKHLKLGRRVLFCGTPCQVRGLKQYLFATKTNTDLLLLIDFACHGVPSNKYFNQFKEMFEKKGHKVIEVDFRHKDFSKPNTMWHDMTLRFGFSDQKERVFQRYSYYFFYYEPFLDNLFLRKSCYKCDIARHSDADIILGDFWGVHKYRKELDDNKGLSFICINNSKYLSLYKELSKTGFSEQLPYEAIEYQYIDIRQRLTRDLARRNEFIKQIDEVGYKKAVLNHYGSIRVYKQIFKTWIKNIIGRA